MKITNIQSIMRLPDGKQPEEFLADQIRIIGKISLGILGVLWNVMKEESEREEERRKKRTRYLW